MQLDDKYENELNDLCWNTDHLFIVQEDLCLDILHNIEIQIPSMVNHDLTVDTYTLLPLPYQIIWRKYEDHVASLYSYMFHI